MKKLFSFVVLAVFVTLLAVVFTGCTTTATVFEFDKEGKVTKKTVTESSAIDKITESTKSKTVIAWTDGWSAYISASTATTEDPTPTCKIFAGKVAKGYISLLKDQTNFANIASVISATKSNLTVSTSGVTETAATQKETDPDGDASKEEAKE